MYFHKPNYFVHLSFWKIFLKAFQNMKVDLKLSTTIVVFIYASLMLMKIKCVVYKQIISKYITHLSLLAYLSDSISSRTSPTLTGPLTFLIKCLFSAYLPDIKVTLTWVIPPLDPVLPNNWVTLALTGYDSMFIYELDYGLLN